MLLIFATKRNANGHRKYIAMDTSCKEYATALRRPMWKDEMIEVKSADLRNVRDMVEREQYTRVDYLG